MEHYADGTWGRFYQALEENEAAEKALEEARANQDPGERSLIKKFFDPRTIKQIYTIALHPEYEDNNKKAELIREYIDPKFLEIGTGTNRLTVMRNQLIYKIALDRRGIIDNLTEFTRGSEAPEYLAHSYETNYLILVSEYVTVMDIQEFLDNEAGIKEILGELSKQYIFDDLGYTKKNYMNWGYRDDGEIVALDYGYLWPVFDKAEALKCPRCGGDDRHPLRYNKNFTGFICSNPTCKAQYRIMDIRRRCVQDMEEEERATYNEIMDWEFPDYSRALKLIEKPLINFGQN